MFGVPMWKMLLGAALQIIPVGGAFFAYENVRGKGKGWRKPAAAAGVYGALQLGVSYLNLQLLTPSIPEMAKTIEEQLGDYGYGNSVTGVGSLYLPRDGGLPRNLPMRRGFGLIDATYKMANAR